MILVGQYDSPFVRRVSVSLKTLTMPYERDTRSVFRDSTAIRRISMTSGIPLWTRFGLRWKPCRPSPKRRLRTMRLRAPTRGRLRLAVRAAEGD
jgi:hypothetical protein